MENFSSSSPNTPLFSVHDHSSCQNSNLQQFMMSPNPYEYSYAFQGGQVDQQTEFHSFPNANSAFPHISMPIQQNGCEPVVPTPSSLVNSGGLGQGLGGFLDPQKTKIARIKRKLARQRTLSLSRNNSSSSSSSNNSNSNHSSNESDSRRQVTFKGHPHNFSQGDQFRFCGLNNKLRVLLVKELKNSDVGALGRIVLPKREAEANLPTLSDKEGIKIVMRDADSNQAWSFKYKFWSNNKSRMYVLENTGEFVKQHGLEMGDSFTIHEDESKNLYYSIRKAEKPKEATENAKEEEMIETTGEYTPRDEDEASLALLIEQLKDKEQQLDMSLSAIHDGDPSRAAHVTDGLGASTQFHSYATSFPF
ncbi:PREDICTED: B3 domain-containing transcription factor LEC2 isoform X2 [Tarenaya hassleriana]|uniref:B3 domain-containing transcription factor LEC2 isoform X2 n=1 Tax=Tarenaya hassleriana TaxID=28532 RepID=UPI00053C7FB4|nr:PREDICTED: B3 domain-containing transcription factor LEC2 isoform X2 [Tarenaya hassleriana]